MRLNKKSGISIFFIVLMIVSCNSNTKAPIPPIPEVSTYTIKAERVEIASELPGRTYAYLIAEVRPQVSGIIQKRLFSEGSDVKAGDLLYQIDPAPFQATYDNALANLNAARKAADRARASLEASLANKLRQQASVELTRANRKRFEELAAEGAVSQSEKDHAITEAQVAEATLRAIEAQIKSDQEAVGVAEAAIKQAEAALESARINLGYTRITAPISGRIGKSNVTVGALVTAHQPFPLTTIQRLDPIYVDATQSSTNLLRLKKNIEAGKIKGRNPNQTKVKLILEDGSLYPLEGTLKFTDVTVDPSTGSFILRMVFPNPKYILLPGMYVRAIIQEGVAENAILIPQEAVSRDFKGNPIVFIVNKQGIVEPRAIILDRAIGDKWLISQGLSVGDQIIIEGIQKVRPGMPVKAIPFTGIKKEVPEGQKKLEPTRKTK